jgi:hypothetical protein
MSSGSAAAQQAKKERRRPLKEEIPSRRELGDQLKERKVRDAFKH